MGLLDQVLSGVGMGGQPNLQKPGLGGTVAAGVLLALLVKGVRSYEASHRGANESRTIDPPAQPVDDGAQAGGLGGVLGGLGGLLANGGGLGGLLGGLGGAGALGALVNQFQRKGYGQQVGSWVGHEPNRPLAPAQVEDALGDDTLQVLQQQTGMPRDALLADLSHILPQAMNEATPLGRLPTDGELHALAGQPPAT